MPDQQKRNPINKLINLLPTHNHAPPEECSNELESSICYSAYLHHTRSLTTQQKRNNTLGSINKSVSLPQHSGRGKQGHMVRIVYADTGRQCQAVFPAQVLLH